MPRSATSVSSTVHTAVEVTFVASVASRTHPTQPPLTFAGATTNTPASRTNRPTSIRYFIDTVLIDPERLPVYPTGVPILDITGPNSLARSALPHAPIRRERRRK